MQANNSDFEIDIQSVLEFFDEAPVVSRGHATALTQMFGEELGASLFMHYLESQGMAAEILPSNCTTGNKSGPRLDRWILAFENEKKVLYQTEIKSWSAHAIGGKILKITANSDELSNYGEKEWEAIWDSEKCNLKWSSLNKVLIEMKAPSVQYDEKRPLLIYWLPICKRGENSPFFNVSVIAPEFDILWVFSMSSYLRSIQNDTMVLRNMPNLGKRLLWINKFFKPVDL